MCGIAGFFNSNTSEVQQHRLQPMTDVIAHRGPDGDGWWISASGKTALGHRRLSIIDLSEAGAQPMHYLDRYTIVFNGEVYNYIELKEQLLKKGYSFFNHTDTEVLLALYHDKREACLQEIDGMFSFAIYDRQEQTLFCARDRFGEKPFYYAYEPGKQFVFASEMKALWAASVPRVVDEQMLYNYLQFRMVQNPADSSQTFYKGIRKLKAAHYITLSESSGHISEQQEYWSIDLSRNEHLTPEAAAEKFTDLFSTSVKRRLRSDVPVGSSLSGGLDSSLVVMTIDQLKKGTDQVQKTFSARFPGYVKDEGRYMQMVTDRCKVEPHFTYPDEDSMLKVLGNVIYHQEEPIGSASICAQYMVFGLAKGNGVTVLLDGQGADEILAGYHVYFPSFFSELKKTDKALYKQEWAAYQQLHRENSINGVAQKDAKYYLKQYATPLVNKAKEWRRHYQQKTNPAFNKDFFQAHNESSFQKPEVFDTLNKNLLASTTNLGLEELLRYADRNSMAHSLEVRLPFLSHDLVEFLFSLPATYKLKDGWTKWLMRYTFQHLLPQEITWRRDKVGYEPPQQKWMQKPQVQEMIHEKRKTLVQQGVLNKQVLQQPVINESDALSMHISWAHLMAGSLYQTP
jgi:asparagine synthase (glutamine-hydrolysing)